MAKPGYEKRRHNRYDVRGVRANLSLPLEVRVLNMSLTGLAIESPVPLRLGGRYHMTLRREHEMIQLNTELQWCRRARTEANEHGDEAPVYDVGLDFRDELSAKARELLGFLQHNVIIELEHRRAFGYFRMDGDSPDAAAHQEFVVTQLSFSGMLIETDPMPEVDAIYQVEVHLDRLEMRTRGRLIHARRVEKDFGRSIYEAGVAFENLEPESQQALEEMVAHFLE